MINAKMKLLTKESWQYNVHALAGVDSKKEATLRKESINFMTILGTEFLHLPMSTVI